jgi:signal transduction histidine kinase
VVTDVTKTLREEELLAWQRLVRVLSHEINNSLAPIKSIAGSLQGLAPQVRDDEARVDMTRGLGVIASRADALQRFMSGYARLARLPAPNRRPTDVAALVRRVAGIEARLAVVVEEGPACTIAADADQLEQALINLIRNAADASLAAGGGVTIRWAVSDPWLEWTILDEGPGISGTANLFVPFFTTKPEGTGVGLVLARQVAEGHGGTLALENREDRVGAVARLRVPIRAG